MQTCEGCGRYRLADFEEHIDGNIALHEYGNSGDRMSSHLVASRRLIDFRVSDERDVDGRYVVERSVFLDRPRVWSQRGIVDCVDERANRDFRDRDLEDRLMQHKSRLLASALIACARAPTGSSCQMKCDHAIDCTTVQYVAGADRRGAANVNGVAEEAGCRAQAGAWPIKHGRIRLCTRVVGNAGIREGGRR